ncbi:2Fe-2S iron-sulfur cluster-binding protein [Sphingomonas sp. KC8]|uniref:2Fe-2S iron-sulfur cluster-binding protein n=1 Tax=Sphingomonas sp. KC8 TaxID=1030157 RepID=UPI000248862D|nr:2Fe-2S iron-sulfur cluster-binding protein [Sphingomonas sp. KC8]ARS29474.1 (2Fe-2S) ferredoxin [Sphingomonas sp. KC8]
MPEIIFIGHDGVEHVVEADLDTSLMKAAVNKMVPGVDGDCGGACACATCHVYVDPAWTERTGGPDAAEKEMLEFVSDPADNSRLACQITITAELHGLTVRLPRQQG